MPNDDDDDDNDVIKVTLVTLLTMLVSYVVLWLLIGVYFANYDSQHQINCCNYTDLLTPKWTVCSPQRKAFGFLGFLNFRIFLIVKFEFSIHDRRRVAAGACTLIGDHSQTLPSHAHIAETIFLMLWFFEYLYQKLIYFPALFLSTQMNDLDFKKLHHPHEGNSYFHDLLSRSYLQHCV